MTIDAEFLYTISGLYIFEFCIKVSNSNVFNKMLFLKKLRGSFQMLQFKKLIRFKIENIHIFNVFVYFSFYQMQHAYFFVWENCGSRCLI